MSSYTEETVEELLQAIEEVANLLRTLLDPAIPAHAKESMRIRAADKGCGSGRDCGAQIE